MNSNRYYVIKPGMKDQIKKRIKYKDLSNIVGINACYMSEIMNARRKTISKTLAYSICKAISPNLEIEDLFNVIEK